MWSAGIPQLDAIRNDTAWKMRRATNLDGLPSSLSSGFRFRASLRISRERQAAAERCLQPSVRDRRQIPMNIHTHLIARPSRSIDFSDPSAPSRPCQGSGYEQDLLTKSGYIGDTSWVLRAHAPHPRCNHRIIDRASDLAMRCSAARQLRHLDHARLRSEATRLREGVAPHHCLFPNLGLPARGQSKALIQMPSATAITTGVSQFRVPVRRQPG
jgi:hypothetical protein